MGLFGQKKIKWPNATDGSQWLRAEKHGKEIHLTGVDDESVVKGCVVIPDGITSIWGSAFSYCKGLTKIVLPKSLKDIDKNVFKDCTSLTDVVYAGTKAEFKNVERGDGWLTNTPITKITCFDGDVEVTKDEKEDGYFL